MSRTAAVHISINTLYYWLDHFFLASLRTELCAMLNSTSCQTTQSNEMDRNKQKNRQSSSNEVTQTLTDTILSRLNGNRGKQA